MKFSTREDIEAPIGRVFEQVTDFASFERQLLRRGVDLTGDETLPQNQPGAKWHADFSWRGRQQLVVAELKSFDPDQGISIESQGSGIVCMSTVELVALSRKKTRMFVSMDLRPTTLSARLLVQSLRLAKGKLTKRFKMRVAEFARGVAD